MRALNRDPIALLEAIGADASLMSASAAELQEALACAELEPGLRSAILAGDVATLQELLRAPDVVCCIIDPAEEEDDEEEDDEEEEEDVEEEDDADEDANTRRHRNSCASSL
jgi:hypothetical protein